MKREYISSKRRRTQGMAVLATLLVMTAVLVVAIFATSAMVTFSLGSSRRRITAMEALNMADAGVDLAIAYLQSQPSPPDSTSLHPLTNFFGTNGTIDAPFGVAGSKLIVTINPDAGNPGPTQKHYLVESKGIMPDGTTKIVRAYLQQVSFGKYAFFADIDSDGFWDWHNHFEGPFHSNCSDGTGSTFLWNTNPPSGTDPIFMYTGTDAYSSSTDTTWWKNSIGAVGAPSSNADFNLLASGGFASMCNYGYMKDANGNTIVDANGRPVPKSPAIPLPSTDYQQAYAALGLTPPSSATSLPSTAPTNLGVTITGGGGLYIHGQSAITLSEGGAGNQLFTVATTSGSTTVNQTVTVNMAAGTATMVSSTYVNGTLTSGPTTTSYSGGINGMLFSDDNITSLSGTVADNVVDSNGNITKRNAWTIATDTGAGKNITLTDSIKYKTSRDWTNIKKQDDDTNFNTHAGALGLLSHDIILKDGAPAQVEFDATMFCTGSYKAQNYWNPPGYMNGSMKELGGVIVSRSGIFAVANGDGSLYSGYQEEYHYDNRMADYPPPYFPTTGNHYAVQSYQMVMSTIE